MPTSILIQTGDDPVEVGVAGPTELKDADGVVTQRGWVNNSIFVGPNKEHIVFLTGSEAVTVSPLAKGAKGLPNCQLGEIAATQTQED